MLKQKNMLAFAFGLSFMLSVYVDHCILAFFVVEEKAENNHWNQFSN